MAEQVNKIKEQPMIDEAACLGCSVCIEVCPMDCLILSRPKYHGDIHCFAYMAPEAKCIGCGMCAKACPIDAIKMCQPISES